MKLLLDIGNTRVKWCSLNAGELGVQLALPHANLSDVQWQQQVLGSAPDVTEVWVSNVAGSAMASRVQRLVRACWQLDAQFVVAGSTAQVNGHRIRNAYPEPAQLGVDRWLAMLAAANTTHTALVVSVGTAMTLDAVTAQGQHLGGLIVPGPKLLQTSLLRNTSDIATRAATGSVNHGLLADNTLGCIALGSIHACVALIERIHAQLAEQQSVGLWLTGGAADELTGALRLPFEHIPDLVLKGLATQVP